MEATVPFNPDSPDYTKLEAAAAQKEHHSTLLEGVDQGGFKEISIQTQKVSTLSRAIQTVEGSTPVTMETERKIHYNCTGSLCGMVIDYKAHVPLLNAYRRTPLHWHQRVDFMKTPPLRKIVSAVSPHMENTECTQKKDLDTDQKKNQ